VRWWKVLGLAGFAGVAASGVVLARAERQRRAYTPQEITQLLHARLAEASGAGSPQADSSRDVRPASSRCKLGQLAGIRGRLGRAHRIRRA
jgi:hypothetical protein